MMFGTFRNPVGFETETGFYNGASERIIDMLLFKDVSEDPRKMEKPAKEKNNQAVLLEEEH